MRTKIVTGEPEQTEVRVKTYAGGGIVMDSGDSFTEIVGKKPVLKKTLMMSKEKKNELLSKPDKFKISKGKLVRRDKKQ